MADSRAKKKQKLELGNEPQSGNSDLHNPQSLVSNALCDKDTENSSRHTDSNLSVSYAVKDSTSTS